MAEKPNAKHSAAEMPRRGESDSVSSGETAGLRARKTIAMPSTLVDTRVIYCSEHLEQLKKQPPACVELMYIDPPFNSNHNYEVFWGETNASRAGFKLSVAATDCKVSGNR